MPNCVGSPGEQSFTVDFEEPGTSLDPMFDMLMKGMLDDMRQFHIYMTPAVLQILRGLAVEHSDGSDVCHVLYSRDGAVRRSAETARPMIHKTLTL